MRIALRRLASRYQVPILITENGLGEYDTLTEDKQIHDTYRIDYLRSHIQAIQEAIMDQVAVVYVPEKIQKERLMARNQLTEEEAQQRIASQWPIEMKKERADIVFDNQGTREETEQQVKKWPEEQTGKK